MLVRDIMNANVVSARPEATVAEVARLLASHDISGMPIVDASNRVVGIVTERDFLPQLKGVPFSHAKLPALFGDFVSAEEFETAILEAQNRQVGTIMTTGVVTVRGSDEIGVAAERLSSGEFKRLPVVDDDGVLIGVISRRDIVRAIGNK